MALSLTRLNPDSSWLIELDGTRILLDPWLQGRAVIGLPVIHQAALPQPTVAVDSIPDWDALVISHPFPDHCQVHTLRALRKDRPVFTPRVAVPFVRLLGRFSSITALPDATARPAPVRIGEVEASWCRAVALFDTTHNALVLRGRQSGQTVVYSPHGLLADTATIQAVRRETGGRVDALLLSFTLLDLPFYLGGVANLGAPAGVEAVRLLQPRHVFSTHDEPKPDAGFIARVERILHPGPLRPLLSEARLEARTEELAVGARFQAA